MSGVMWEAPDTVEDLAQELLGTYHPEVATAAFAYVFKDKASATEIEAGIIAVAKKVPPMYKILTKEELDFVVLIAKPLWDELSPTEKKAHLDSALCSCTAKLDEHGEFKVDEQGNPIFCLKQYDLQGHSEVLARYGVDVFAEVGSRIKSALKKAQDDNVGADEEEPEE